jgi:cytochrome P450
MNLDAPVPDPGPSGPYGTMAWLRATVSRFANGETHARRRALVEELLAELDPAELREEAAAMARAPAGAARPSRAASPSAGEPAPGVETPYLPVAVLARRLGAADLGAAVAATRVVAAAYQPHTSHPGADDALVRLLSLLPGGDEEVVAARVAILVQACEATAGLVRGEDVPVPVTRRVGPDGEIVLVDLSDCPFGAGARRCPGEAHARALAEGLR